MKVAVIGPAPPFRGGIAQHTRAIELALVDTHQVVVHPFRALYPKLLFPGRSQLAPVLEPTICPRGLSLDPYRPWTWQRVAAAVRASAPDLVLVQWWHPWFALPTMYILSHMPPRSGDNAHIAVICHNVEPHGTVPMQRFLARSVLRRAGRIVLHSESEAIRARKLAPGIPTHVLPMPALMRAPTPGQQEARDHLGLAAGRWLLFFGHVRRYKGLVDLLDALALLADPSVHLLIVGEFYEPEARYRARIGMHGIGDRVRIVNRFVADAEVPMYFAAADALVLPYRRATQTSVLQHAIHHRIPAVVTDAGGLAEAAPELVTVVPAGDPEALAQGILHRLGEPAPAAELFAAGAERSSPAVLRQGLESIRRQIPGPGFPAALPMEN